MPTPTSAGAMKAVLTDARFSDPAWIFLGLRFDKPAREVVREEG